MQNQQPGLTIPGVDLDDFRSNDAERKQRFVQDLGHAYEEYGFVAVRNHGVPNELVNRFYRLVEEFFAQPAEVKRKYEIAELAGQRGYTSFGREHAKGYDAPDLKEFWQIGQEVGDEDPIGAEYPRNIVVSEIPEFHETGRMLYRAFESSGRLLLRAIAIYLGLHEDYFEPQIRNGNSILRAIHYPPITHEPKSSIRAEQHEDINLITLLVGASAEGLQLLDRSNRWIPITAPEGYIIVNVGDMLQRLTNDKLSSTTHRVVNPPREKWHTHRYSIPFFLHPRSGMPLDCLPSCVDADHPRAYDDITAGEYLDERLVEIGLKKK
jgi:isopenicillin N synthase-like dioxygenase